MNNNLSNLGYRMPAEWEKQESIWITWPYNKKDWPDLFESIPKKVAEIVSIISKTQKVNLIIKLNEKENKIIRILKFFNAKLRNIKLLKIQTDRIWIRDFGPIYLVNNRTKSKIFINFKFNGWSKYKNFKKDNKVNLVIHKKTQIRKIEPRIKIKNRYKKIILEGGAIDVNGKGSIMLTKECLLSKIQLRNPGIDKLTYERVLSKLLNVNNFIWLNKGIVGDDTHGHVDDISRFVSENTIMTAIENNKKDKNYQILKKNLRILKSAKNSNGKKFRIIKIPMPKPISFDKVRVPASYMNFLICNKIVLLPIFNDECDLKVIKIFKKFFKNKKIVGIDCSKLIWGFGAVHCMTQQEPKV
tara:strand:+ start:267 stop:1337 length:1071 start_codon:yes stop_codon:yes gene_type:complete